MSDAEIDQHIADALAISPEPNRAFRAVMNAVKRYFNTSYFGEENIPDCPVLFVGMHSAFAADSYIAGPVFRTDLNRFVRMMGEKSLFEIGAGKLVLSMGGILGHPKVCNARWTQGTTCWFILAVPLRAPKEWTSVTN